MPTDMQNVTTEPLSIGDLLSSRVPFQVPAYQRTYAWTGEELGDFVTDVLDIYRVEREGAKADEVSDHFFGGLVSVQHEVSTKIGHRFELVDGQQRMSTFFMTLRLVEIRLRAIGKKNEASDLGNDATESADFIAKEFLQYRDKEAGKSNWVTGYRLLLSKADRDFFRDLLDGNKPEPGTASHRKLRDAWNYLDRELIRKGILESDASLSTEEQFDRLSALQTAITERSYVIHIRSSQRKQAYRLFQVLNDRGRALTDGDLLRARTMELLEDHADEQRRAEEAWNLILSDTDAKISRFLRDYYGSVQGRRAPRRDLFDAFMHGIFGSPAEATSISSPSEAATLRSQIELLKVEWITHSKLRDGFWPFEDQAASAWRRERLVWLLKILNQDGTLPLLLAGARTLPEKDFARMVSFLDRFVFRHRVLGDGHPSRTQDEYFKYAQQLRNASDSDAPDVLAQAIGGLRALAAKETPDEVFAAQVAALRYDPEGKNTAVRYLLTTLNDHVGWLTSDAPGEPRPDETAASDPHNIDIEHIRAKSASGTEFDVNDVGNLTIWSPSDNRAARDAPFEEKRAKYAASKAQITQRLAQEDAWGPDQVKERRELIVGWSRRIFAM